MPDTLAELGVLATTPECAGIELTLTLTLTLALTLALGLALALALPVALALTRCNIINPSPQP